MNNLQDPFNILQNTFPTGPFLIGYGIMQDIPQSVLGRRVPPENLAKFGTVLMNLGTAYYFNRVMWEDRFMEWINVYSRLYHSAVHFSSNRGIDPRPQRDESIRGYNRLVDEYKHHDSHEVYPTNPAEMPSFDELWDEAIGSCDEFDYANPINGDVCQLCQYYMVHGKQLAGRLAYAFAFACCFSFQYAQVIRSIMHRLPVYTPRPSNFPYSYIIVGTPEVGFPVLKDAVKVIHSHGEIALMTYFGPLLALTVDTFELTNYTPTVAQINVLQDRCANVWNWIVRDVYDTPFSLRVYMANINLRGIVDALVHKCRQFLRLPRSPHTLGWSMHVWFFMHLHEALLQCDRDIRWAHDVVTIVSYGQFDPDVYGEPIPHYRHQHFTTHRMSPDELQAANEDFDLEDVQFVPHGPLLDPMQYTTLVTQYDVDELCVICQCGLDDDSVVKLPACNHLLHLECVRTMINGIEASSNLCPLDRTEICPRRQRRLEP